MIHYSSFNDHELTGLLRTGDEAAFTEIYNRYWDRLYYIAHKLLKEPEAAEEIVQDVFLLLWRKRETLTIHTLDGYLAAMTRYAVFKYIAKEKNYKAKERKIAEINAAAVEELNIDQKMLLQIITDMADKLPEKCRLVFYQNKLMDRSLAEVAEQLNISQKTAEGHLTKALRVIRANLGNSMSDVLAVIAVILLKK